MRGWMQQVNAWPSSPLTLLREQATALRDLLRGATVTIDGTYVQLTEVRLEHPADIAPRIVAGVRGPRSLALAGEVADGVVLAEPVSPEYVRAALAQLGVGPGIRLAAYNVACVDDDADRARRVVRPALEWIGEPDWAAHIVPLPFGTELVALRAACRNRVEFVERLPDEWVDQLAVVGTPGAARARIDALHDAGATSVVLICAGPDAPVALESLARVL
jgi:alkanesulfonate monooxygenase SsuD/methylene tetrahydromethanopterin reductase-like flavin-dependent oxidoreductase (luciferase family)